MSSDLVTLLLRCKSPVDLMLLAGLDPEQVTSPAIAAALDETHGVPSRTKEGAKLWKAIAPEARGLLGRRRTSPPRRTIACIGRRGLKSSGLLSWKILFEALCRDHDAHAAPGSNLYFPVVAPRSYQASESMTGIVGALEMLRGPLGVQHEIRDEEGTPTIRITNPGYRCEHLIEVFISSEVSVRGFAIPYFACDEAGFFPADGASSLRAVVRALAPGGLTFPQSGALLASSPGAPEGLFFEQVEKPPKDALLIRASSWIANPRITRERCWSLADEDATTFAIEYAASRFGYSTEGFIDTSHITYGDKFVGLGVRKGFFVVAFDAGQLVDNCAFVVLSVADVEIPGASPVRHFVVEEIDAIPASKTNPPSIEMIVARACGLSSKWGGASIVSDPYLAVEAARAFKQRGFGEYVGDWYPTGRSYWKAPMSAPAQTPRWNTLRSIVGGDRLHLPDTPLARELVRQLGQLTATTLSTGSLKVEGRRDDLADALALAVDVGMRIPPTATTGGAVVEMIDDGFRFSMERKVHYELPRFVKKYPNGDVRQVEIPRWHHAFPIYAEEMIATGCTTPEIEAWQRETGRVGPDHVPTAWPVNIQVRH
jgi:hypothetical protein